MIVKMDSSQTCHCKGIKHYVPDNLIIVDDLNIVDYILINDDEKVSFIYVRLYDLLFKMDKTEFFHRIIQQRKNFKHHFLLIDWNKKKFKRKNIELKEKEICDLFALINIFTTVLLSFNTKYSYKLMDIYAFRCFNGNFTNINPCSEKLIAEYLMSVENISKIKANNICRKLKLKTVDNLLSLRKKDLLTVSGIGLKSAEDIVNSIK